jgi:hypothetical protein
MPLTPELAGKFIANAGIALQATTEEFNAKTKPYHYAEISVAKLADILEMPELPTMLEGHGNDGEMGREMLNTLIDGNIFSSYDPKQKTVTFDYDIMQETSLPLIGKQTRGAETAFINMSRAQEILKFLSTDPIPEKNFTSGEYPGKYAAIPWVTFCTILDIDPQVNIKDVYAKLYSSEGFVRGYKKAHLPENQVMEVYTDRLKAFAMGREWISKMHISL